MSTDLERAVEAVEAELRERLKLKYCGKCQLVPLDLIERAILALAALALPLPPPPVERKTHA